MIEVGQDSLIGASHLYIDRVGCLIKDDIYNQFHAIHQYTPKGHEFVIPILFSEDLAQMIVVKFLHKLLNIVTVLYGLLFFYVLSIARNLFVLLNAEGKSRHYDYRQTQGHLEDEDIVHHFQGAINAVRPSLKLTLVVLATEGKLDLPCFPGVYLCDFSNVYLGVIELKCVGVEFKGEILK